jgi:probable rRNA maturation factor
MLRVHSRPRSHEVDCHLLECITGTLLRELFELDSFTLQINIVAAPEMTRLNETFLRHRGSTDVLAFDYREPSGERGIYGEIFVCKDEAIIQAARFHTTWQSELVRYVVHAMLHLMGYDDQTPSDRRKMKAEENRWLKELARRFDFSKLDRNEPKQFKPRSCVEPIGRTTTAHIRIKKTEQKLANPGYR